MTFTPAEDKYKGKVIFFEDSTREKIPGYASTKTIQALQGEIIELLQRMGADNVAFSRPGKFSGFPEREGYEVLFQFGKMAGKISCAALPLRSNKTEQRRNQALKQALFLLRDQLKASMYTSINKPAADMLIPYLLDSSGRTVTETLIQAGSIPMLPAPTLEGRR